MSQENGSENFYTTIHRLLIFDDYARAAQVVDEKLSVDSCSREAILSWTELKLLQGQTDTALKRLGPLMKAFPEDPYYLLAWTEIVMQEFYCTEGVVTDMLDRVAECAGGSSDVLAKIGFVATSRGYWSYGMRFFIEALRARERVKTTDSADLILLWKKNEASLDAYLQSLVALEGRGLDGDTLDDVPLEMIVRTVCILVTAKTEGGISEAWPIALRFACNHREISAAFSKDSLVPLLSRFCLNWVGIETIGGTRQGPWSTN